MQTRWWKCTNSNNIYSWIPSCLPLTQVISLGVVHRKRTTCTMSFSFELLFDSLYYLYHLCCLWFFYRCIIACSVSFLFQPLFLSVFIRCTESFWCFIVSEATEWQLFVHACVLCVRFFFLSFKSTSVKSGEKKCCFVSSPLLLPCCFPKSFKIYLSVVSSSFTLLPAHSSSPNHRLFTPWLCYSNIDPILFLWHFSQ